MDINWVNSSPSDDPVTATSYFKRYYTSRDIILLYFERYYTKLLTKITATQYEVALSYNRVRGLCFLAVIFAATIFYFKRYYTIILLY